MKIETVNDIQSRKLILPKQAVMRTGNLILKTLGIVIVLTGIACSPWVLCALYGREVHVLTKFDQLALSAFAVMLVFSGIGVMCLSFSKIERRLLTLFLMFGTLFAMSSLIYFGIVNFRSKVGFDRLRTLQRGWGGKIFKSDPELGFAMIPNSRGEMTFPIGPMMPTRHDSHGFRIPINADPDAPLRRPLVLSLGCSFTYGDACPAEDTFTYLTGKALNGSSVNAGECAYGLVQMLILARRYIPQYRPDYVLVQYSPWLIDRALSQFAPTYFGRLPTPRFTEVNGEISISPPPFLEKVFDLPISDYEGIKGGNGSYLSFLFRVGIPLFVHDDYHVAVLIIQDIFVRLRNGAPSLSDESLRREVVEYTYSEIERICMDNGARMFVINLNDDPVQGRPYECQRKSSAVFVDALSALVRNLPAKDRDSYYRAYGHWRGDPPVMVDGHPNPLAHKIIAEEILKAIASGDTSCHLK